MRTAVLPPASSFYFSPVPGCDLSAPFLLVPSFSPHSADPCPAGAEPRTRKDEGGRHPFSQTRPLPLSCCVGLRNLPDTHAGVSHVSLNSPGVEPSAPSTPECGPHGHLMLAASGACTWTLGGCEEASRKPLGRAVPLTVAPRPLLPPRGVHSAHVSL